MSQFNHLNSERNLKYRIQNHEFDFMESAWEDMEKVLDQNPTPGPVSDYGNRTSFVSFASLIKMVVPLLILFTIIGWVTIQQQETAPPAEEEQIVPPAPQPVIPENIPIASTTTPNSQNTSFAQKNTSESNHSNPALQDANARKEGTQNLAMAHTLVDKHSASSSSSIPTVPSLPAKVVLASTPSSNAPQQMLASTKLPNTFPKIQALDIAQSVDFNQHTSIAEFVNADTSIFYTGKLKLQELNFKPKRMNWGLAIGSSISNIDWSRFKFSLSPQAGVFVSYQLNEKYALQAELLVKNKANYDLNKTVTTLTSSTAGTSKITENFSIKSIWFVELPMMVKKKITAQNLNLVLGVRPSYIVHQAGTWSEKIEGLEQKDSEGVLPIEVRDGIATFDLGLLLGLEYKLNQQISLNLRYNQGFNDITKNEWFADNDLHLNSDLLLALQYQF